MSPVNDTNTNALHPTRGSVLQFTPDHSGYHARFSRAGEQWAEPVIGWAVVVTYVDNGEYETEIEPVVLFDDSTVASPINDYLSTRVEGVKFVGLSRREA